MEDKRLVNIMFCVEVHPHSRDLVGNELDTIGNHCWHKNVQVNEQRGAVDSITHCNKWLPLKSRSFRERSNFPLKYLFIFRDLRI